MSAVLNSTLLTKFLKEAGNRLMGEWLLVGGTLLPAVGIDYRSTVDIDLINLDKETSTSTLKLMELAESLGLPVESVNQAAAFFLKKSGYARQDLILLYRGKSATIYRPSVELYWKLKMGRLSETDLEDCHHYFVFCREVGDDIDLEKLEAVIRAAIRNEKSTEKRSRLKKLKDLVSS